MDVKKIVIVFSVLLMLSGAAISVMKWLQVGPFADVPEEDVLAAPAVPDVPPVAIEMEDLVIPIFAEDRVAATVMIKLHLETVGPDNEDKVTKLLPRISDAFLRDLYAFIPRVIRRQNKLNASILVERMKMTGAKVMGPDVIHNVIIDQVVER